ncbi:hypothetical protein SARC_14018, partial [Sphaeroforma arctica JP610]
MAAIIEIGSETHDRGEEQEQVFVRKSIKYVLPNDSVKAFIDRIQYELPISSFTLPSGEIVASQMNNSSYFDDEYLNMYKGRVVKNECAELYRVRWYGTSFKPVENMFIERKRHHNYKQVQKYSNKKRLDLPKKEMNRFLTGKPIEELNPSKEKLAKDIQEAMVHLQPKVRTQYLRTSFMKQKNQDLRITLDRDIVLFAEPQSWAEIEAADGTGQGRGEKMPFSVVEVKVAMFEGGKSECPEWIHIALMECNARKIKLSKYGYGCAQFYPKHAHPLPKWNAEVATWSDQLNSSAAGKLQNSGDVSPQATNCIPSNSPKTREMLRKKYSEIWAYDNTSIQEHSQGSCNTVEMSTAEMKPGKSDVKPGKAPTSKTRNIFKKAKRHGLNRKKYGKTDGKAFMANERTYLNYIQWTSSLATFCVGLLQLATGREVLYVSTAIVLFCDMLIMYATTL